MKMVAMPPTLQQIGNKKPKSRRIKMAVRGHKPPILQSMWKKENKENGEERLAKLIFK